MRLNPENTTALVVDLQARIVPAMRDVERLLTRTKFLLSGLNVHTIPVVSTRQYPKGLGDTLPEIAELMPNASVFDKTTFSCLETNAIRDYFVADSRPNVLLFGIETHICILQTALDLLELGKSVYLVADCLSSRDPFDAEIAMRRLAQSGAILTTAEAALFEITHAAGSAKFKEISKLARERK